MKVLSRTVALFMMICVLLVSLLSGCGVPEKTDSDVQTDVTPKAGDSPQDTPAQKSITLTIEGSQAQKTNSPHVFYQDNIDAFEKAYPHIKVEQLLIPDAQATSTLQTKLAAGEPSDIVVYNKVSAENELNAMLNMVDLSNEPWVKRLNNPDAFRAPDGKIYGFTMATTLSAQGIVYNKDIFKKLNLSVPTSYDEFLDVCEKIKAAGIMPIYAPFKDVWTFQIWTAGPFGTYAAKKEPDLWDRINSGEVKWTEVPAFLDILEKGYNLYKKGYMPETLLSDDYNSAPAAFSSGQYAMMIIGDWFITDMETKAPDLKLGLFPVPAFNDMELCISQSQMEGVYFVPKQAKHVDEAKLFIDFMSQKEQMDRAQNVRPFVPTVNDASEPQLTDLQKEIVEVYMKNDRFNVEMNAFMRIDLNDLWRYYQDMFAGTLTPEEVLEMWDKKFAELMRQKGAPGF